MKDEWRMISLPPLKPYKKEFEHSYTFGVFPTLELLSYRPERALQVLFHSRGERNEGVAKIREVCRSHGVRVELNDKVIERLSPKENSYAVGVFRKWHDSLDAEANHLVLVNPGDMGNLGTIMRTMLGFWVRDLALVRPAADVFDPRAVRASMGALFSLRCEYFESFDEYRARYERHYYPFMTDGTERIERVRFQEPFALIFGNESAGLSSEYGQLGISVRITHTQQIDSLNLPVAVAIALYEAAKQ
jgi:TrmH family RNA methyltransferase